MQRGTPSECCVCAALGVSDTDVMLVGKVTATVLPNGVWLTSLLRHSSAIFPNFLPRLIRADFSHFMHRG